MAMIELDLNPQRHLRARKKYLNASPYPHSIIDGMWPEEFLNEMIQEWPSIAGPWRTIRKDEIVRNRNSNVPTFPPSVKEAFDSMSSSRFINQLEQLTGYPNLIPDPRCHLGAGMHHDAEGAYLNVHSDALWARAGYRVVNIFLYLNPEWKPENGGELVLWDADTKKPTVTIPPLFNRTVIMATDLKSWHEVLPVRGMVRRSLAFYYYVQAPPSEKDKKGLIWRMDDDDD